MMPILPPNTDPADEASWSVIRSQYDVSTDFINLENGFFGIASKPVLQAFEAHNRQVYREGAYFLRAKYPQQLAAVMEDLSRFTGVSEEELLIVRNPTEAMNILLQGYGFRPGDEVIASNQDYDSVDATLEMMMRRDRFTLKRIQLPRNPRNDDEIVALYENAITPKTRVIVLTHLLHQTGQILPVARIAEMARERGIDMLTDAAHSFAHIDYRLPDLGCSFVAVHLHKWLGAPLGLGLLYIQKERIADISPLFGNTAFPDTDIRKLGNFGTTPPASKLAIADALAFHNGIGGPNKEARLRYLKEYWVSRIRDFDQIELMVPDAPERSCAIAGFRVRGMDAQEVADYLMHEHRIYTVVRFVDGLGVIRVTPHLYNTIADLDRLVAALERFA